MIKKIIWCVIACGISFWIFRIYSINQFTIPAYELEINQEYKTEKFCIEPVESYFFSMNEFLDYFNLPMDSLEGMDVTNSKLVCICLKVSNVTDKDISWDEVMEFTSNGFETETWGSINMTTIGGKINMFREDCLKSGAEQRIWYITIVNPISFKSVTWENLKCSDFYYVLSLYPRKVKIRLE